MKFVLNMVEDKLVEVEVIGLYKKFKFEVLINISNMVSLVFILVNI